MVVYNNILAGAAGSAFEGPIKSVRFNSADSAYLNRTPSSAGNRKTWTWAGWVKRTNLDGALDQVFIARSSDATRTGFGIYQDKLYVFFNDTANWRGQGVAVLRDTAAWYHVVMAVDTTQATESNRIRLWVNNQLQTISTVSGAIPPQGTDGGVNNTIAHAIGVDGNNTAYPLDGYLADVYFIDGQALDPTSFGAFDGNGVWQAAAYRGGFGTNGFHLPFSDNSTAAALGTDTSGNGNDWTVNNIEVPSGTVYATGNTWDTSTATAPLAYKDGVPTSPYVIDITGNYSITYPSFAYTGSLDDMFDGTDSVAYLLNDYINQSTYSFLVDLRDFTTVTSVSVRGYALNYSPYTPYKAELLDSSKTLISGTTITLAATMSDNTVPVSGSPRYLRIFRSGGAYDRGYIAGFDINGTRLVNGPLPQNYDSLVDSPTNGDATADTGAGGEVSGNYCTWNPLSKDGGTTYSNGNLDISSTNHGNNTATFFLTSGKWYWEGQGSGYVGAVCGKAGQNFATSISATGSNSIGWWNGGPVYWDGGNNSGTTSYGTSDIIGTALDMDNGKVYFYKNGTLTYTITFGSGTVPDLSDGVFPCYNNGLTSSTKTVTYNFGQRAFAYSAPSGYKALCTTNLPTPTIADGSDYFDTKLWTGNGSTQTISGLKFSPDLVWIKSRSGAFAHLLFDQIRGTTKYLSSNTTGAEGTDSNSLTAFTSDGFSVGTTNAVNQSGGSLVAWAWDAGSSTVSNTDGSITSSVRANQTAGFSIITFTMPTVTSATIGHGLNTAPAFYLWKDRDSQDSWYTYHSALGADKYMSLDTTNAVATNTAIWNNTAPTNSVINTGNTFSNTGSTVVYAFAPVAGYSAFGSYEGNGLADGSFVYTGFRPALVIVKRTNTTGYWPMFDSSRDPYNVADTILFTNDSGAESTGGFADFLSNGFKIRSADINWNASSSDYIYMAWAENPFQANGGLAR